MDVELLSKMVTELIIDHDVVGLPCMGSFVASEVPATFSDKGYTINPPYRKLSFSESVSDDGLLYSLYAASNGVGIEEAKSNMDAFLTDLREALKLRKSVSLPSLGRLRSTEENKFFFVADEDLDIYPEGFGLKAVSLKTHSVPDEMLVIPPLSPSVIKKEDVKEEKTAEPDAEKVEVCSEQHSHRNRSRLWVVVLALVLAAILLPILFLALSRLAPNFIDTLLYTPEELKIINS